MVVMFICDGRNNQKDVHPMSHLHLSHQGKSGPEIEQMSILKLSSVQHLASSRLQSITLRLYPGSCLEPVYGVHADSDHIAARAPMLVQREQASSARSEYGERESPLSPGILTRSFFKITNHLPKFSGLSLNPPP